MSLTFRMDTYRTHYTNDSLPQEARVDVISPFSPPLEKQSSLNQVASQFIYSFVLFLMQFEKLVQIKAYMKTLHAFQQTNNLF